MNLDSTNVSSLDSRAEVHQIHDRLTVKTDLVDKIFSLGITGQAEEAAVKLEEFSAVNLGVCPAMETTTKSFKIANYGRFPLSVEAQAAYPIKIHPPTITVNGGEDEDLHVSWFPSGAYELRSIVKLLTNIGPLDVTVRGKALLPELVLRNNTIDFGVCAVGHSYDSKVAIFNKGKVPLHWNLPATRDGFSFAKDHGIVESGASEDLIIRFSPTALGRKMTTFLLECRGLNFKELHLSGVGGTASLEVMPDVLDFGRCRNRWWFSQVQFLTVYENHRLQEYALACIKCRTACCSITLDQLFCGCIWSRTISRRTQTGLPRFAFSCHRHVSYYHARSDGSIVQRSQQSRALPSPRLRLSQRR